jgi:hypothetical protein
MAPGGRVGGRVRGRQPGAARLLARTPALSVFADGLIVGGAATLACAWRTLLAGFTRPCPRMWPRMRMLSDAFAAEKVSPAGEARMASMRGAA